MLNKLKKTLLVILPAMLCTWVCTLSVSAAVNYDTLSADEAAHLHVANGLTNLLRAFGYTLLTGLCKLIDDVVIAINTILDINLYTFISDIPFFKSGIGKIATAIVLLAVVIAAIYIMLFPDKIKVSDTVRSILITVILIVALPSLIAAVNGLASAGISTAQSIQTEDSTTDLDEKTRPMTIGEQLLCKSLFVVSDEDGISTPTYDNYLRAADYISPYDIDINQVLDNKIFTHYVGTIQRSTGGARRFDELSIENCMTLLGLSSQYQSLLRIAGSDEVIKVIAEKKYEGGNLIVTYKEYGYDEYVAHIIGLIEQRCATNCTSETIDAALTEDDVVVKLIELNYINNLDIINKGEDILTGKVDSTIFNIYPLRDNKAEQAASTTERIIGTMQNGFLGYQENLYMYDVDFVFGFVVVIATLLALFFAGFKVASTLYDQLFIQTFGVLFIASDVRQTGRAKKTIEHLVKTSLVLVVILLIIKIYLIVVGNILASDTMSFGVKLFLILGGVKFVIDGPDFITAVLGIDAGVKSGMAAAAWVQTGARATVGAAKLAGAGAKTLGKGTMALARGTDKGIRAVGHGVRSGIQGVSGFMGEVSGTRNAGTNNAGNGGTGTSSSAPPTTSAPGTASTGAHGTASSDSSDDAPVPESPGGSQPSTASAPPKKMSVGKATMLTAARRIKGAVLDKPKGAISNGLRSTFSEPYNDAREQALARFNSGAGASQSTATAPSSPTAPPTSSEPTTTSTTTANHTAQAPSTVTAPGTASSNAPTTVTPENKSKGDA